MKLFAHAETSQSLVGILTGLGALFAVVLVGVVAAMLAIATGLRIYRRWT